MSNFELAGYILFFVVTAPFWSGVVMGLSGLKRENIVKDIDKF
jgi:hypothetical protein|tara:strand:- start:928 stop:1056 length:129 start_codon:yes stop_codon:yes gene_type:complete